MQNIQLDIRNKLEMRLFIFGDYSRAHCWSAAPLRWDPWKRRVNSTHRSIVNPSHLQTQQNVNERPTKIMSVGISFSEKVMYRRRTDGLSTVIAFSDACVDATCAIISLKFICQKSAFDFRFDWLIVCDYHNDIWLKNHNLHFSEISNSKNLRTTVDRAKRKKHNHSINHKINVFVCNKSSKMWMEILFMILLLLKKTLFENNGKHTLLNGNFSHFGYSQSIGCTTLL